jgi:hypothetical protein
VGVTHVLGHPLSARLAELGKMRLVLGVENPKLVVAAQDRVGRQVAERSKARSPH